MAPRPTSPVLYLRALRCVCVRPATYRRLAGSDAADRAPLMNTRTDTRARERGPPRRHPDLDRRLTPSRAASNCDATRLDFFQHLSHSQLALSTPECVVSSALVWAPNTFNLV